MVVTGLGSDCEVLEAASKVLRQQLEMKDLTAFSAEMIAHLNSVLDHYMHWDVPAISEVARFTSTRARILLALVEAKPELMQQPDMQSRVRQATEYLQTMNQD